jgi:hypothetical protein
MVTTFRHETPECSNFPVFDRRERASCVGPAIDECVRKWLQHLHMTWPNAPISSPPPYNGKVHSRRLMHSRRLSLRFKMHVKLAIEGRLKRNKLKIAVNLRINREDCNASRRRQPKFPEDER